MINKPFDNNSHEAAVDAFDKALEIDPKNSEAWFNRGNTLIQLCRIKEAINAFKKTMEIEPNHPNVFNLRNELIKQLTEYE